MKNGTNFIEIGGLQVYEYKMSFKDVVNAEMNSSMYVGYETIY